MNQSHTVLAEIPLGGNGGALWNLLHGEREDICEAMVRTAVPEPESDQRQKLLQARLRRIDDALDRLMSGAYGFCSNCGHSIEAATLDLDPASTVCGVCWERESSTGRVAGTVASRPSTYVEVARSTRNESECFSH